MDTKTSCTFSSQYIIFHSMEKKKTKCLFVYTADTLHRAGGVQKVFCSLATALAEKGWDIIGITESPTKRTPFYPLDNRVRLINAAPKSLFIFGKTIRKRIMKWIYPFLLHREKPDVVLCFSWNDLERLPSGYPTVLMQHVPPCVALKKTSRPAVRKRYLSLLSHTSCVQVLLSSFQTEMHSFSPKTPVVCIGNAVEQHELKTDRAHQNPIILSIGRLEPNKNQLLLIQAFSIVCQHMPQARLILCGGSHNSDYETLCQKTVNDLNLTECVSFLPETPDLLPLYYEATVYATPSLFEGWGLTVTEAMSVGLPIVGLKSADGINALVQDGKTGLLTDNTPEDFARALIHLIKSPQERIRLGKVAHKSIQTYSPEKVWTQWDKLLRSIASQQKPTKGIDF